MKKIITFLITLFILNSSFLIHNCKCQWVSVYHSNLSNIDLYKIQFVNEFTGYIVGENYSPSGGILLKTSDGGNNWNNITSDTLLHTPIFDCSFINANTGFLSGYTNNIYKTTNGCLSWSLYSAPTYGNTKYLSIQFVDGNTGFIGGRYGLRAKSTNGGISWDSLSGSLSAVYSIFFFNANTGFTGDGIGVISKTINGGLNWSDSFLVDTSSEHWSFALMDIDFINQMTGYAVGLNSAHNLNGRGAIFKTTNGGNNWSNIFYKDSLLLYSIDVINNSTLFISGNGGRVLKSSNGGNSWVVSQLAGYNITINYVRFINENTGFTCGYRDIYKTTNGGTGINQLSVPIPNEYLLQQNYPNPFNPTTVISFQLPVDGQVSLKVFDLRGREAATLVNEKLAPGTYTVDWNASQFPSGVYFYRLQTERYTETRKMLMIK